MKHFELIVDSYPDGVTKKELKSDIYIEEDWENESSETLKGWFAVSTPTLSIIAYFGDVKEAYKYKRSLIKRILKSKKRKK